jgi:hypothetical protein
MGNLYLKMFHSGIIISYIAWSLRGSEELRALGIVGTRAEACDERNGFVVRVRRRTAVA